MRRLLHTFWLVPVALLIAAVLALYYLGWTESGLQTLGANLSRRLGPVTLRIEGVSGTLAGGAHIASFTLDHKRTHIDAHDLRLRVEMMSLLWMNIRIPRVDIATLRVQVFPRIDDNTYWSPHFLRGPLTIDAPEVHAANGTLIATNGRSFDVTGFVAGGIVRAYTIDVYSSTLQYAGVDWQADGELKAADPIGLTGNVRFTARPDGQPAWVASASFNGNLAELPIKGMISEPLVATFSGSAKTLTSSEWNWSAKTALSRLDLRVWGAGNALGVITGELQFTGDRNGIRANGEVTPPGLRSGPLQVAFDGNYGDRVLSVGRLQFTHRQSGSRLDAIGSIGLASNGPRLDLRGQWQTFRWPLSASTGAFHSPAGEYTLRGVWPYDLHASGTVGIDDLPMMPVSGDGQLFRDHLAMKSVAVDAWGGKTVLSGEVRWSPSESWQLGGDVRGLVVEQFRPGVNGTLNFHMQAQGTGFGDPHTLGATFTGLSGNVRGQRATGHAQFEQAGSDWLLSDVRLQLGQTRIDLDGRIGGRVDLRFDVSADDLALLQASARGKLAAKGSIRSGNGLPAAEFRVNGSNVEWNQISIGSIAADVDFDPMPGGRADVSLKLAKFRFGTREADTLNLSSTGAIEAHHLQMDMNAPQMRLHVAGNGSLHDQLWQMSLAELTAEDGRNLQLALEAPALLKIGANLIQLEQLCLRDAKARVCGQVADLAGERSARFNAENLPLRALTAGLIAATDFDGTLSVNAEANAHREGGWIGSLRSQLQGAAIRHRHSNGRMESFDLGTGSVSVTLGADTLVANVGLNAGNTGLIEGSATARTNGGDWQQWPMTGHVKLQSEALGMLDSYFPQIDRASGKVTADLDLGGAVWAPSLSGTLSVRSARIDAYQVGASLRDLNLDAQLHDNTLAIGGSATAGVDGTAKFSGNLRWQNQLLYGTLHLDGQNLLIVDIPEAKIYAAPNVDLTLAGRRIDVTGTIELPNARLEQPEDLATAVRVSGDTRIIQAGDDTKADPFPVYSNVTLKLGDRVTINTSGLQARLSGSITSVTDESGFSRGTGELSIEEGGKYTAYGRRLDITRGRLLFTNSPMGNPGVDLRAVKKFPGAADVGEVTAGVNVRGTLSAPTVSFFSDPPLPQLSIVSLLISGGSLDNVLSGDSAVDATAERKARLLQGSAILAQQLGKRVGADVSVEQDLQNDTSLVLGRFLSPRLYVSYGISFAEAINTIKMNYTIGDKWTVRTESGQAKSADLVYTIRK